MLLDCQSNALPLYHSTVTPTNVSVHALASIADSHRTYVKMPRDVADCQITPEQAGAVFPVHSSGPPTTTVAVASGVASMLNVSGCRERRPSETAGPGEKSTPSQSEMSPPGRTYAPTDGRTTRKHNASGPV